MNYSMPEVISEPVTLHDNNRKKEHKSPTPPMPPPRSMPIPAPGRETAVHKIEVEKVEIHAETHKNTENKTVNIDEDMIMLCARHMLWTHSLVISVLEGLPDVQSCSRRVKSNNNALIELFKPQMGKDAAKRSAELLNQNLVFSVQLAQVAKVGNQKGTAEAWGRLTQNADDMLHTACESISGFDCEKMKKYYFRYLELLKDEINFKTGKR